ncbi:hypothetical protein B9Z55_023211 [Caenorhabditis nigoni]|uniref:Uncharacterized protein n=1 Tax=Caenorhabditis nigoni TaxID=1611254 RepID=A0A2G5SP84_9PELO|nr:hypothetical protein B9Z55_023211 [Caenorhabditis nigoni]
MKNCLFSLFFLFRVDLILVANEKRRRDSYHFCSCLLIPSANFGFLSFHDSENSRMFSPHSFPDHIIRPIPQYSPGMVIQPIQQIPENTSQGSTPQGITPQADTVEEREDCKICYQIADGVHFGVASCSSTATKRFHRKEEECREHVSGLIVYTERRFLVERCFQERQGRIIDT